MSTFILTVHAGRRMQQRGIRPRDIDTIIDHADCVQPVRDGCCAYQISRRHLNRYGKSLGGSNIDKLRRTVVILNEFTGEVVTVFNAHTRSSFWRYKPN